MSKKAIIGIFFKYKKYALECLKNKEKLFKAKYAVIKIKGGWLLVNQKYL